MKFWRSTLLIFWLAAPLSAQGLPQIDPVRATMLDSPRNGVGLALINESNQLHYLKTAYGLVSGRLKIEVYLSRDPQNLGFGSANIRLPGVGAARLAVGDLGYRVLGGKPSYLQVRRDGLWLLFVFPDEVVDVAGFIQDFNDCMAFFEKRLPKAPLSDWLPSLVGTIQGVR